MQILNRHDLPVAVLGWGKQEFEREIGIRLVLMHNNINLCRLLLVILRQVRDLADRQIPHADA